MHELILWCGFAGAWLLVLGPLYQAAIELRDEDLEQDRVRATMLEVEQPPPVSPWWLLVPPVWWWRRRRVRNAFQTQMMAHLTDEDYEAFNSFLNKAHGWMFVGLGGFLIAAKETWELVEGMEWPTWLLWPILVVVLVLCIANAGLSGSWEEKRRQEREAIRNRV